MLSVDGTVRTLFNAQTLAATAWSTTSGANFAISTVTDPAAATHFYLDDHLATAQLELSSQGYPVWRGQFAPFGAELDTLPTANHYKFTGKERDAESGLDYFGARYYASGMGRWMTSDPKMTSGHAAEPQSWNRYSYVGNNPLKYVDPSGLEKLLVIYVQQPNPGHADKHVGDDPGHTFIGLRDTDHNVEAKFGFYPANGAWDVMRDFDARWPGKVRNNDRHGYNVSKSYKLSDADFAKLIKSLKGDLAKPPEYSLNKYNCTDWVIDKAHLVNINIPSGHMDSADPNNPGALGEHLGKKQGADTTEHPDAAKGSLTSGDPNQTNDTSTLNRLEKANKQ